MVTAGCSYQHLAACFTIGTRVRSAPVARLADAKRLHFGHVARPGGAGRRYIFADGGHPAGGDSRARELRAFLASGASPVRRFTPAGAEPDSVIGL